MNHFKITAIILVILSIDFAALNLKSKQVPVPYWITNTYDCEDEVHGLPTYTTLQVGKYDSKEHGGIWTSYKVGVYNLTEFIEKHPGGPGILASAGGHLEPFWNSVPIHKKKHVYRILEKYRVGNLDARGQKEAEMFNAYDPFGAEQTNRNHLMEVISETPFNAHPYPSDLVKSFITPDDFHYVRLHLPIPQIRKKSHSIVISGSWLAEPISFKMSYLETNFVKRLLNVTLQCSGNRRFEMNKIRVTHGVPYKHTAISTATWGGVFLTDLLSHFGVKAENVSDVRYVDFEGADHDPSGQPFGASISADIALDPRAQLLVAYEMNGAPLPPDHGFPVRMIVPGMAGFKSVKFLTKIILGPNEVSSVWERRMYRFYPSRFNFDNVDYDAAPSLLYTNVQSAILVPSEGDIIEIRKNRNVAPLVVKGYAFSGGGNIIRRVDVSSDGGQNWVEAEFEHDEHQNHKRWTWILWEAKVNISAQVARNSTTLKLHCRAFDNNYNSQPKDVSTIWNMMGVLVNHWHSVSAKLKVISAKDKKND